MSRLTRLLLCAFALVSSLFAQASGRLSGSVSDASGAGIPGATVELFLAGGANAVSKASTNAEGSFEIAGLSAGTYDVSISSAGFRTEIIRRIELSSNIATTLKPVRLELSQTKETIEVSAEAATVQTSSVEVSAVVTNAQLRALPSLNRSPVGLLLTQAGVSTNARTNTTINGLRPSFANITLDGINIQDNFIRTNTVDFQPNMLLLDQVAEATIVTSNSNPALGNGAAQINFSTPSGTNQYKGSLIWLNRNNIASANTWFNNFSGVRRPFLNQNQFGGAIGGPIVKDKLLFYANYEALRLRQQTAATRTGLRSDARSGIVTYIDTAGNRRSVNVLSAANLTQDARTRQLIDALPSPDALNRTDLGDGLNTAGIGFNIADNRTRDNILGKVDYYLNQKNHIMGTFTWNRDIDDRPDQMNNFATTPVVRNDSTAKLMSLTHRWNPNATFTNELRGGFNLTVAPFNTDQTFDNIIIAPTLVSNPVNTFRAQGRNTDTYNLQNNSTWTKGKHTMQFGYQSQFIRVRSYNDAAITATYNIGISAANPINIDAALPGIRAADRTTAYNLLALHAGFLTTANQTFNVKDRTSGFLPNQANVRNFTSDNYAAYFQDRWRATRNLTINMGLRWDYFPPVDERDALALLPVYGNRSPIDVLLDPVGTLDFAGNAVGRSWYKKDFNNFAPNLGIAWDPFGKGRTSLRAGYSVNFANDEFIRSVDNNTGTNAGLSAGANITNLTTRASAPTPIPTPAYRVPRTYADNFALSPTSALGIPDPSLVTPYVQQWSAGIQHEWKGGILEVRYVGNRATKQFRAFDYNQVLINVPGYATDFNNARRNGELARAATGSFNPSYNANIPGSVPLPFFAQLPSGGSLAGAAVSGFIERGEIGELANNYMSTRANGPVRFYRNFNAQGTNMMTNYSNASYHGFQIDYTRRFQRGLYFQANYVWSKNLSDATGDAQARFEPFLDINNPSLEYGRTFFDLRQQFKSNWAYELPIGKGKRLDAGNWANQIIGGWTVSGFLTLTSGSPFNVFSNRGTLNRQGRSANNMATSLLSVEQLESLMGVRREGNGIFYFSPTIIGPDTRAVAADGRAPFQGQVFFNPGPGELGTLGRRVFNGPIFKNVDMALQKSFNIMENRYLEFRTEAFNMTNTVSFDATVPNTTGYNINNTNFGRITATQSGRRIVQFSLRLVF